MPKRSSKKRGVSIGSLKAEIVKLEEQNEILQKSCDIRSYVQLSDQLYQERYLRQSYEELADSRLKDIHNLKQHIKMLEVYTNK